MVDLYLTKIAGRKKVRRPSLTSSMGQCPVRVRISGPRSVARMVSSDLVPAIEGFQAMGWKGWIARAVDDPELRIGHLRQMGSSQTNRWHGRMRWGRGKYFMGSQPYYAAAVALYRALERPYVVGGAGILWGYVKATFARESRMEDPDYLDHLRSFELRSLLLGRRRTIDHENERIRKAPPPTARCA